MLDRLTELRCGAARDVGALIRGAAPLIRGDDRACFWAASVLDGTAMRTSPAREAIENRRLPCGDPMTFP
jgi:hypothetical protein